MASTTETALWAIVIVVTVIAVVALSPPRPPHAADLSSDQSISMSQAHMQNRSSIVLRTSLISNVTVGMQAVWVYGLNLVQRWRYRHIPGPPPKWLLGNAAEIQARMMHGSYEQWAKKYGPVCRIFMGMRPLVIITGLCFSLNANSK